METILVKGRENIINNYGVRPTLPFDIEGKVLEKNGKDIKIEKKLDDKTFNYTIRLKNETQAQVGENIKIDKNNIMSYKVEEESKIEEKTYDGEKRNIERILSELGLEFTEENVRLIEHLLQNGIKVTRENVDSYIKSREYLTKILDKIDISKAIKLTEMGLNIEDESLQKIAEALDSIDNKKFSFRRLLGLNRDLTYNEAEEISKEIYGQKMGKDVYDIIISLKREKVMITRENIDNSLEIMKKIHNLKGVEDKTYIKIMDEKIDFNIDNIYKVKNQYTSDKLATISDASSFENMTIKNQASIDSLKQVLKDLGLEDTFENTLILREFIANDMDINIENYNNLMEMKEGVRELLDLIKDNGTSIIIQDENILKENIYSLVEKLKLGKLNNEPINDDKDENASDKINVEDKSILGDKNYNFKLLASIEDKELLDLIKKGEDFNVDNILEIKKSNIKNQDINTLDYKTLEKADRIINIFRTLGDKLSPITISTNMSINKEVSLESLYNTSIQKHINIDKSKVLENDTIEFIQSEYIRIKNTLTTNVIKQSLIKGHSIERMPLTELNPYIEKNLTKYRQINNMTKDIKNIEGKEERIITMAMKNNLEMTLGELKDIDMLLNGERNLLNTIKQAIKNSKEHTEEFKETIKTLQKSISDGIKRGESIHEDHKRLINTLNGETKSNEGDKRGNQDKDYFQIKKKISKKDRVIQLPVEIGGEYKTLNVIIPNAKDKINKDNMSFFISLETENVGRISMDISVKGKEIYINCEEGKEILNTTKVLEDSFKSKGFTLKNINQVEI